ncbi:methionyl-tRNA formyltransferase [bacterium]|nr:methionyl-tRNA formyltransferase [bacterium]
MTNKERIIFWGSPETAKGILAELYKVFEISAIVTQPDRPYGRKKILTATCVKTFAIEHNIPVHTPEHFTQDLLNELKNYNAVFSIVVAYGNIIPKKFLNITKNGALNIHYSLLPKLKGPAPISYAILEGNKRSGVSIIQMNERMDAGDILKQTKLEISDKDDYFSLEKRLTEIAISDITDVLKNYHNYFNKKIVQVQKYSSYTPLINKEDSRINWYDDNIKIFNKIRAFTEWPQTFSFLEGKRIKIIKAELDDLEYSGKPGTVFDVNKRGIFAKCGKGSLIIKTLKPEGKNEQSGYDFFCGNNIENNICFTTSIQSEYNIPKFNEHGLSNYDTITIHHTNSYNFHKDQKSVFEEIKTYHITKRKWNDIGYHFVIGKNGEIFKGRDLKFQGAHVKSHNENNIGIALIGDFNLSFPRAKQIGALETITRAIRDIKAMRIRVHRDFLKENTGECPGDFLYDIMEYLND